MMLLSATRASILALLSPAPLIAQGPAHDPRPSYVIDQWSTEQGLPQNTVAGITQGRAGYLWLATNGGLVRFDGVRFTVLTKADHPGIPSDRANSICADTAGVVWVGTESGAYRVLGDSIDLVVGTAGTPSATTRVTCARNGSVWIAAGPDGVYRWRTGTLRRFPIERPQGPEGVIGVAPDGDGGAWLDMWGHTGRVRATDSLVRTVSHPDFGAPVTGLRDEVSLDEAVFITPLGFHRLRAGHDRFLPYPRRIYDCDVSAARFDNDEEWWLATARCGILHRLPGGRWESYGAGPEDRPFQAIAIFRDREGVVWAGSSTEGLFRLRPRIFDVLTRAEGLTHDLPMGMVRAADGALIVGSNCAGVMRIDRHGARAANTGPVRGCVWPVDAGPGGVLWYGTFGGGAFREWHGHYHQFSTRQGTRGNTILAILAESSGVTWLGGEALHEVVGDSIVAIFDTTRGLPTSAISLITRTRDGTLWVGTPKGAARLSGDRLVPFTRDSGLGGDLVRAITQTADGALWFGTYGGGLTRRKDGQVTTLTTAQGLAEDVVSTIVEDGLGDFWFSGNRGISRVRVAELNEVAEGRLRAVHAVAYGVADGLRNAETNGGFTHAVWRDPDGRLWYPTLKGLASVDPRRAIGNPSPPGIIIEDFRVDGLPHAVTGRALLARGTRNIDIRYTGLSSSAPERVTFRYRLAPLDDDWQYVGERRELHFAGLSPGHYDITVDAASRDGIWSGAPASLGFTIPPPFWATWWFRAGSVAAAVLLIWGAVRSRVRRLQVAHATQREFSRRVLESQEHERARIAAELHDAIGQGLLVMKNRAELALRGDSAGVADQLRQISDIASETLEETRSIARNLHPYQLDRLGLATAIRETVDRVAAGSGITFTTHAEEVEGGLDAEGEITLFRIVQEAVNNVLKHSRAREAHVTLLRDPEAIHLVVSDDGRGMTAPAGFGIHGIAERVRHLGGRLETRSAPGQGTSIDVRIPTREE